MNQGDVDVDGDGGVTKDGHQNKMQGEHPEDDCGSDHAGVSDGHGTPQDSLQEVLAPMWLLNFWMCSFRCKCMKQRKADFARIITGGF